MQGTPEDIGIPEFDEFRWRGEQYTEETENKRFRRDRESRRLINKGHDIQAFAFVAGPESGGLSRFC